jgi:hypothetical protein
VNFGDFNVKMAKQKSGVIEPGQIKYMCTLTKLVGFVVVFSLYNNISSVKNFTIEKNRIPKESPTRHN